MSNTNQIFDATYWDQRWHTAQTQWDMGAAAPVLMEYVKQIENKKNIAILIPGCGNAYEAEALLKLGFDNVTIIDISATLVAQLKEKYKDLPDLNIVAGDVFEHQGTYDLILEQTFFCAIDPTLRSAYSKKIHELLKPNGHLVGVLFNREFEHEGPPFGGHVEEYKDYFGMLFEIKKMEPCYNSIAPRAGSEVFINLVKKQ